MLIIHLHIQKVLCKVITFMTYFRDRISHLLNWIKDNFNNVGQLYRFQWIIQIFSEIYRAPQNKAKLNIHKQNVHFTSDIDNLQKLLL